MRRHRIYPAVRMRHELEVPGGYVMNQLEPDVASSLLSMPSEDFHTFVRDAVRDRRLRSVVHVLNTQALSKTDPNALSARAALTRLGFID